MAPDYLLNNIDHIKNVNQSGFLLNHEFPRFSSLIEQLGNLNQKGKYLKDELIELGINENKEISRDFVFALISQKNVSQRVKILTILMWGAFFQVVQKQPKLKLLKWITGSETEPNQLISNLNFYCENINNSNFNEQSIKELFKSFDYKGDNKIPGLSFAYFTKLFYFFSKDYNQNKPLLILDKWSSLAWINLSNSINENRNNDVKKYFNDQLILQRRKPEAYFHFNKAFWQWSEDLSNKSKAIISADMIEEFVFGWDLGQSPNLKGYLNPRLVFQKTQ